MPLTESVPVPRFWRLWDQIAHFSREWRGQGDPTMWTDLMDRLIRYVFLSFLCKRGEERPKEAADTNLPQHLPSCECETGIIGSIWTMPASRQIVKVQIQRPIYCQLISSHTAIALKSFKETTQNCKSYYILWLHYLGSYLEVSSNGEYWIFQCYSVLLNSLGSIWKVASVVSKRWHHSHFHSHFVLLPASEA